MVTLFRITASLVIVCMLSACGAKKYINEVIGGVDNTEPPSPLVEFVETAIPNDLWSKDTGKGTDELYIELVPAVLGDQVFMADTRGNIVSLTAATGKSIWNIDSELQITGGPGADVDLVMVGTSEGEVLCLATETGDEVWKSTVSSEILSSPREADGVVIVRTIDGKIFALEATTGERLWVYDRTVPALTLRGTSTPSIANGLVIAGFDGGRVTALDLNNGKLVWETRVAVASGRSELERMVDIDAQPLIVGDVIYVTTFQANVTALSLDSGQILWQRDISSHNELAADGNGLYVTDEIGNVWALDRFSGASIWKQEKLTHRKVTGPAVIGDKVVVGDLEGYLHWMNKATGRFAARTRIADEPILTKPIVSNDILFAYSSDGTLAAYTYLNRNLEELPAEVQELEATPLAETAPEPEPEKSAAKAKEEEEDDGPGFFGRMLEVFTGDPDDEEEEEEVTEEQKKETSE